MGDSSLGQVFCADMQISWKYTKEGRKMWAPAGLSGRSPSHRGNYPNQKLCILNTYCYDIACVLS